MIKTSFVSDKVRGLKPSGIRRFFDLAANMDEVISLGVGEPDFVTPWNIREAAIHSIEEGYTTYTANAGMIELRREISHYMENRFKVSYDPENQIIVTVGASQAIDLALRAILNPGEEVIVVEPCFVAYAPLVTMAGGVPVTVSTSRENDFRLMPEQLEAAITPKTKAVLICSPNNPTGTQLGKADMEKIAAIVKKHDLLIISDEIYAELSYDEPFTSFAAIEGMSDRTILVNGFSKAFAMTGWRLGFVCSPKEISEGIYKIHQYGMMCASTMSQHAGLEALKNGMTEAKEMVESYRRRRNYIVKAFNEIGLECHNPGGAFYAFPSIRKTGLTSQEFAEKLLMEEHVAAVPGDVFGESGEGHLRCSYATSIEQLKEAINRIERFLQKNL